VCGLTPRGSAAGDMPAASEFYGPLSAIGGQHRAEPEALSARQLQPLLGSSTDSARPKYCAEDK